MSVGIKTLTQKIQSQHLIFTNQSAVFWLEDNCLLISDLHVGKAAHFRKFGIAVPSEILHDDLRKLGDLIKFFNPKEIIIVGDFLHSGNNSDIDVFCEWQQQFSHIDFILVKGNHDRWTQQLTNKICLKEITNTLYRGPFMFVHEPKKNSEYFCISGHIHPGVLLKQGRIQSIKLPCFALSDQQLILPAFSKFTGLDCKTIDQNFVKIAFSEEFIFAV